MAKVGKRVVDELYVHLAAVEHIEDPIQAHRIQAAIACIPPGSVQQPNVAKLNLRTGRLSLLAYPTFDDDAFPELAASWSFAESGASQPVFRSYESSLNRPILHRKELLTAPDHPQREEWQALTATAESLGLFDETSTIGFRLNWERLIHSKGYQFAAGAFLPLGNVTQPTCQDPSSELEGRIQRHLTALVRSAISAPVQLLIRQGLLTPEMSFFDYGCGRGGDVESLRREGYSAAGWDPHFVPDNPRLGGDVVNLGFVVNVIEDPAERVEALHKAFALTRGVLAVGVMLYGNESTGRQFGDGVLTSRNTFQKYFSQAELKDYLEHVLHRPAFMAGPGVAFVFADKEWEQRFSAGRYRSRSVAARLLMARVIKHRDLTARQRPVKTPRPAAAELRFLEAKPFLDALWGLALDLGRWPDDEELRGLEARPSACATLSSARRLIESHYDQKLLAAAARTRTDDLRVFFAAQQFEKRPAYKQLEPRLQRDVKAFFGDYRCAQASGLCLLQETAEQAQLLTACQQAAAQGLGWLDGDHSLQLHLELVERLPAVLRAYVTCGLVLWDSLGDVNMVKIHLGSGKLTLLEFDEFDQQPLPTLRRRVKVNLRRLDYDVFDYGSEQYPKPLLYRKSRFMHEDQPGFAEQQAFDEALDTAGLLPSEGPEPSAAEMAQAMTLARQTINGMTLARSTTIPDLDQACGRNFTYRALIECGETQSRLGLRNLPLRAETYNALYDLATQILDPVVEYFGAIKLTYGFCSAELGRQITKRVAPKLDQHAACELGPGKRPICPRGGAACDFIVEDEDMSEVADWLISNLPFDRVYYYGPGQPVHVSFSGNASGKAFRMVRSKTGNLMPRNYSTGRG